VLSIGPRIGKGVLTAEKIIESIVVPSYPQTSRSSTSGVLTIVPVASVEKTVNLKSFAGPRTSSERGVLSEQRRESRLRNRTCDGTTCAAEVGAGASDDGLPAEALKKLARRTARKTKNKAVAAASTPDQA